MTDALRIPRALEQVNLFRQHDPECVDERCNAENAARKCGIFIDLSAFDIKSLQKREDLKSGPSSTISGISKMQPVFSSPAFILPSKSNKKKASFRWLFRQTELTPHSGVSVLLHVAASLPVMRREAEDEFTVHTRGSVFCRRGEGMCPTGSYCSFLSSSCSWKAVFQNT